ncbi:hypothetical protein BSKO_03629 [Bryopsis sp. KO-2023]|nr:hypothetical protein BSKO_03629 [Bryopsis sp. KO-2023]
MARYAGGKTKKEKTADKRHRRLANREAKQNVKWVLIIIASLVVLISALVWMSSRESVSKANPKVNPKANSKANPKANPKAKTKASSKANSEVDPEVDEELVKMFKEKIVDAMGADGIEGNLEELLKDENFKEEFQKAMEREMSGKTET